MVEKLSTVYLLLTVFWIVYLWGSAIFFSNIDLQLASAVHPRFKLDWLDESNTDEKSLKEAITIKLQNQMTLLVPGSMSMETRISPDDQKDFHSSLKKNPLSTVAHPIKIELSRFFEEKNTENLQVLNAYPIIKKLFLKYNTALFVEENL